MMDPDKYFGAVDATTSRLAGEQPSDAARKAKRLRMRSRACVIVERLTNGCILYRLTARVRVPLTLGSTPLTRTDNRTDGASSWC